MDKWHVIKLENMLFQICHLCSEKAKRKKQENLLEDDLVLGWGSALMLSESEKFEQWWMGFGERPAQK